MAWREKKSLTCPKCNRKEPITWVLGRPLKRSDKSKGYLRPFDAGGWIVKRFEEDQAVICPDCGTEVKRRSLYPNPRKPAKEAKEI